MKPRKLIFSSINNQLTTKVCIGCCLSWLQSLLGACGLLKGVERMKHSARKIWKSLRNGKLSSRKTFVPAVRAGAAQVLPTLQTLIHSKELVKAFPRVFVGLMCAVVLAPYSDIFYTQLDFHARVPADVWYYESYYWLFLCIGPYLKGIFSAIGWYLVVGVYFRVVAFPLAIYQMVFDAGKLLWMLQVKTHAEYLSMPPALFNMYGLLISGLVLVMFDRLTYWLNHRVEAFKRRMKGLHQIAFHVDAETFRSKVVETLDYGKKAESFKA